MNVPQLIKELYLSNKQLREFAAKTNELVDVKFDILNTQIQDMKQQLEYITQQNQIIMEMLERQNVKKVEENVKTIHLDETDKKLEELSKFNSVSIDEMTLEDMISMDDIKSITLDA